MNSTDSSPPPPLIPRDPTGHKGTFGTVAVIGGCGSVRTPMIGAPTLAARAAFRAGCGLVRLIMPDTILRDGLILSPSATGFGMPIDHDAMPNDHLAVVEQVQLATSTVIGPGLGADREQDRPLARLVADTVGTRRPMVIDADALNALSAARVFETLDLSNCILTPHPGEFARIARSLNLSHGPIEAEDRGEAALELAHRLQCVIVLKGAGTVVSDGNKVWTCDRGHHCLATAGTGDVLAGICGSFCAQFLTNGSLYNIARQAVWVHAVAGERWSASHHGSAGMLASELADLVPESLAQLNARGGEEPPTRQA